jgi:hypothetical protein
MSSRRSPDDLSTVLPIVWTAAAMRHGDYVDVLVTDPVDDFVGETYDAQLATGQSALSGRADFRMCANTFDCLDNSVEQFCTQSCSPRLVPLNCRCQFVCSGLTELRRLHRPRMSFSIRRRTLSQGSNGMAPLSIAAMRRSISASHACSAPGSDGPSKLASSSAANSARVSSSRRSASAKTEVIGLVMPRSYASRREPTSGWTDTTSERPHAIAPTR